MNSYEKEKIFQKASELGKKAADTTKKVAKNVVDKTKVASDDFQKKQQEKRADKEKQKFNPLYLKDIRKKIFICLI